MDFDEFNAKGAEGIAEAVEEDNRARLEEDTAPIPLGDGATDSDRRRPLCRTCAARLGLLTTFVETFIGPRLCTLCGLSTNMRGYFVGGGWVPRVPWA